MDYTALILEEILKGQQDNYKTDKRKEDPEYAFILPVLPPTVPAVHDDKDGGKNQDKEDGKGNLSGAEHLSILAQIYSNYK